MSSTPVSPSSYKGLNSTFPSSIHNVVPTVVTFGTTGAGKSSVINMLPNDPAFLAKTARADFSSKGVTEAVGEYHKLVDSRPVIALDTMGTGEPSTGTIPTHLAIERLYDHLIESPNGVHLIMIVMKAGRMTSLDECNYLLARFLFGDEVPIVLVLTHLENAEDKDSWWEQQEEKGRFALTRAVGVVASPGLKGRFKDLYDQSASDLADFIAGVLKTGPGFKLRPRHRVRSFIASLGALVRANPEPSRLHNEILQLLLKFHVPKADAQPLAKKIQGTVSLPVVVFVGAPQSGKSTLVDMLPDATGDMIGPGQPPSTDPGRERIRDLIKVVNGERIRVIDTLGIGSRQGPFPLSASQSVRALHEAFIAHASGIRLVVLVARTPGPDSKSDLTLADRNHHLLVKRLCGEEHPICFVITHLSAAQPQKAANYSISVQKHIQLAIDNHDSSARTLQNTLSSLVQSHSDCHILPQEPGKASLLTSILTLPEPNFDEELATLLSRPSITKDDDKVDARLLASVIPSGHPPSTATILVVGLWGRGKSPVVDMLGDAPGAVVDDYSGQEAAPYRAYHKLVHGQSYHVVDVGAVSEEDFMTSTSLHLHELLVQPSGTSLVLFVITTGRLTAVDTTLYELIRCMCGPSIPIALVLTHGDELLESIEAYARTEAESWKTRLQGIAGFQVLAAIPGYQDHNLCLHEDSKLALAKLISETVKVPGQRLRSLTWKEQMAEDAGYVIPGVSRDPRCEELYSILHQFPGMSKQKARRLAKELATKDLDK